MGSELDLDDVVEDYPLARSELGHLRTLLDEHEEFIQKLQHALYFWLPEIPNPEDGGPTISQDFQDRIAQDAQLLAPMHGDCPLDTAESFGWIELRDQPTLPHSGEKL